uniref:ArnT family glycosyltransferase n=1 Tax=Gordonia jinhuaensis TaxID=1517702 RepID=UPI001E5B39E0|nr:glycosyltransferase family 39 protein [Gordonia jinhuaensis]
MTATVTSPVGEDHPHNLPTAPHAATARDRILLGVLLIGTAILYLVNITANGNANTFYAGAAWAGSRNWEALLFGSVDPSNFITVDKPPVSQWIMGLSGQLFGYSSAAMLIPEALMGVATVALMYAMVTRIGGRTAGLIAGTALAVTPVAALMFRFNNPDAAMVLLMTAAAYCTVRATASASARWLALAGAALGFAFLAKMLEGLMVLPALGLVYLIPAPSGLGKRIRDLLLSTVAMVAAAGWYVLLTLWWPASSRPYLAGSTDNNFMNLVLGYNGLARIEGHTGAHGGTGGDFSARMSELTRENPGLAQHFSGGEMFGAKPGITRLFTGEFGAEISFFLPMALIAFVLLLVLRARAPRTDAVRAGAILFGMWLLVDSIVLSYMNGTTHPYYSLAIAPPIAGLVGLGVTQCWAARSSTVGWKALTGRLGLSTLVLAGGAWSFVLLDREAVWQSWLRWVILIGAVVVAVLLAAPGRVGRGVALGAAALGVLLTAAAPAAFAINGDTVAHTGGSPSIIPKTSGAHPSAGTSGSRRETAAFGGMSGGFGGGRGGFGSTSYPAAVVALVQSSHTRWSAAVDRTEAASGLELAARVPVMGVGGFSDDPAPSLAQFQKYVADKDIGYYVMSDTAGVSRTGSGGTTRGESTTGTGTSAARGQFADARGGKTTRAIDAWVTAEFAGRKVGDFTVYDLTVAPSPQSDSAATTGGSHDTRSSSSSIAAPERSTRTHHHRSGEGSGEHAGTVHV